MKAFEYNSQPMQFVNLLMNLTVLNLLWLVSCLPIITIGAATTAQYQVAGKCMDGDRNVFKNYISAFKKHFKQSTVIWFIFVLLTAAFYMAYHLLTTALVPGSQVLFIIAVLAFIALLFTVLWAFPVMVNFKGSISEILFNGFVFSFMYTPLTLIAIGIYAFAGYLMLSFMSARVLFLVFGHALIVYANLRLFRMAFRRHQEQ